MLPLCRDLGVGVVPWSPLARGYLAGGRGADGGPTLRARTDEFGRTLYGAPADTEIVARLATLAARRGVSNMQLALAWVLSRPGVTAPIVGVTKPEQLDEALAALAVTLDADEAAGLEAPYQPRAIAGFR
jgi:aryl-alcohol dehydrogenase-like predicted oxidoreductase